MVDYKTYEELPKRVQYFVDTIKEHGYTDIRSFESPCKYFDEKSFGCKVWVDAEETVQRKIPYRHQIQNIITKGNIKNLFGIGHLSVCVHYKNKQQLGNKFLPELKKRLKSSEFGDCVHSVRFNIKSYNDDPEIFVVLRYGNQTLETYPGIKNILTEFMKEKEYFNMNIRIT